MGWGGYGLYDGDGTQTCHLSFMEWAGYKFDDDKEEDDILKASGTLLTSGMQKLLQKNIAKVLANMPKLVKSKATNNQYFKQEDDAIEWQMLLALYLDNGMKPPKLVKDLGIYATEVLINQWSDDFDNPGARKRGLKNFIKKATKK